MPSSHRLFTSGLPGLAVCAIALAISSQVASATVLTALQLNVYRDGAPTNWLAGNNLLLADGFNNGDAYTGPAFPNGQASTYTLQGLAAGADAALAVREQGGALLLDPLHGAVSANALGGLGHSLRLQLQTNITDANSGLPRSRSFAAALVMPLTAMPDPIMSFGLRFSDGFSNNNDVIELSVANQAAGAMIIFRKQDFDTPGITQLGSTPLAAPLGAASLMLSLSHPVADSDTVFGRYCYLNAAGTLIGDMTTFATSTAVFNGELHTRVQLRATAPVPEPATWALFAAGLGLFGALRRIRV